MGVGRVWCLGGEKNFVGVCGCLGQKKMERSWGEPRMGESAGGIVRVEKVWEKKWGEKMAVLLGKWRGKGGKGK